MNSVAHSLPVMLLSCFCLSLAPSEEPGTWSVAAVDFQTGQIGIAGASCTTNVQGIGEVIPGVGVVVVQGMSSDEARSEGMDLLRAGVSVQQIVEVMREQRFDPENQQYAIVALDSTQLPATYTGRETADWHGASIGDGVAVQGNSLKGSSVVEASMRAFEKTRGPLAVRLVRALQGGDTAGGDKRCESQRARSAFVTVYNADDPEPTPYFHLVVYGIEKGGRPAVPELVNEFNALFPRSEFRTTTRVYVSPG